MTPEERQRVSDLFARLAQLESTPRDAEAERAIGDGLTRAPHAVYALVQTALVQDEALWRADARIRELSGETAPHQTSFLDSMRNALGGSGASHTSVPSVRAPSNEPDARWNSGGTYAATAAAPAASPSYAGPFGGGSFLGTAAASAAGAIGGALLLNSISSMFGHRGGSAFAAVPPGGSPWDAGANNSELARDAGLNDIGGGVAGSDRSAGLFGSDNAEQAEGSDFSDDSGGDSGGEDSA